MARYISGTHNIQIDQFEPEQNGRHSALLVLHGSGGAAEYWMGRFAPTLREAGVAIYAPHYFEQTGTSRATMAMILDGRHFIAWLTAVQDAVTYVAERSCVDASRIGVLGISLGGYLAVALGIEDKRIRTVVELSGGVPLGWEDRMTQGMPPTLVMHGDHDDVVPVAEAYKLQTLLEQHKVPHELKIFPHQTHWFSGAAQMQLLMTCAGFIDRHLFGRQALRKAG
jgi:dipeptidyl aminopeptidase/acylaminoacyl peptidase